MIGPSEKALPLETEHGSLPRRLPLAVTGAMVISERRTRHMTDQTRHRMEDRRRRMVVQTIEIEIDDDQTYLGLRIDREHVGDDKESLAHFGSGDIAVDFDALQEWIDSNLPEEVFTYDKAFMVYIDTHGATLDFVEGDNGNMKVVWKAPAPNSLPSP